ncbi:MAG: hypothetical protein A3H42_05405 [Deltaproteobacteria bacterium RIFCSPLOWO2_02_FULL_46_8]|nr:MAG: hypothetical protein A3H42_05405 [Deltaproteobacteria bacterium RIFCSPLOWO2_02_FULL_46_8]
MMTPTNKNIRSFYPLFAHLFDYPSWKTGRNVTVARDAVKELCPMAVQHLSVFTDSAEKKKPGELEEIYTHTFCLTPLCVPYVSTHLFGEESFQRTELMCRLKEAYQQKNFSAGKELPDHIAVLLRFAPKFTDEEWREMVCYCLKKAVRSMFEKLKETDNIYRHLFQALHCLLEAEFPKEVAHA